MKIGILSDTHNLLRPEVLSCLRGCDAIIHGGDICKQRILDQLAAIAPLYAVRGNNDKEWAEHLPAFLDMELDGLCVCVTHKKKDLPAEIARRYGMEESRAEQIARLYLTHPGVTVDGILSKMGL